MREDALELFGFATFEERQTFEVLVSISKVGARTALSILSIYRPDDLRRIVQSLTQRGVRMEFVKEGLTFTGEDSPMANLMLSVMGAFAEFERSLIRERQREGIALAKQRGAYRGRKKSLNNHQIVELKQRIAAGEQKTLVAHNFGISRETLYQYLRES